MALPLDALVEVRLSALQALVAALQGRRRQPPLGRLTPARVARLISALRALDARRTGASYRQIAAALAGAAQVRDRGWKTHDLRDRTIRLVRYGERLMRGGYRQLLRHPARRGV